MQATWGRPSKRTVAVAVEQVASSAWHLRVLVGRQPKSSGHRRRRTGGQDLAGLEQGLEAGDNARPALADHRYNDASGFEPVVDDRQLHHLTERLDLKRH